ncbi:Dicarboxylate/amino acid:cation symporter [Rickettsiales endosymbiont of Paramecium tredecaurelia]|uniref:dicarboxylate/amino acid:cation symporter n=1 Tax=Candidatus Sarmatiella mevalonica TaxID=2770581 RepID=UPI001920E7AD|nr:dicarboxylate/amino acid:cation symporter [Candidatus Sarmatiella mevalonica]MBL3285036.1 Dicarboxylate/amino acid:cation symporter [Candidatus Sarmatiella mevalonica]
MALWKKVILAIVLGVLFGMYLPQYAIYIKPIGDIFIRLLKVVITPLVFFSILSGMCSMESSTATSRVSLKSIALYVFTTITAIALGIAAALILRPGDGIECSLCPTTSTLVPQFKFSDFLINIIPSSPLSPFIENNVLQAVFLALLFGYSISQLNNNEIKKSVNSLFQLMIKVIIYVVELTPYATFSFTAWLIADQGFDLFFSFSSLALAVLCAIIVQYLLFGVMILVFCRMSPMPFYRKSLEYQLIAFSTSSSKATLPTTMKVCREDLGVSASSTAFVLPLGASMNMVGLAIKLSVSALFFAQLYNTPLGMHEYAVIIFTSTIGSIGGAGIPGGTLVMLPMILSAINLPIDGVALLAGIERIMDMASTAINITGDAVVTVVVDHSEGTLDKKKYLKGN